MLGYLGTCRYTPWAGRQVGTELHTCTCTLCTPLCFAVCPVPSVSSSPTLELTRVLASSPQCTVHSPVFFLVQGSTGGARLSAHAY